MKFSAFCTILSLLLVHQIHAGWEEGKYADAFMDIGVGARGLGMGSAYTALVSDVTSIYWNPAGLAGISTNQFHVMHSERFAGMVNWDFVGVGFSLSGKSALGIGFYRLAVDNIAKTRLLDPGRALGEIYLNENGERVQNVPFAEAYLNDQEMAFSLTLASQRTDALYVGASVKILRKILGPASAWGLGFDLGMYYRFTPKIQWGMRIADITTTFLAWENGRKEYIYPKFIQGFVYNFQLYGFSVTPVIDLQCRFNEFNRAAQFYRHSLGLDIHAGIEIGYKNLVAIRGGSDRGQLALGTGLAISVFSLDYGFASQTDLGHSHRISLTFHNLEKLRLGF